MQLDKRRLTYDLCKEVASNCKTASELKKKDCSVYNKIRQKNWNHLLSHMISPQLPTGYWNYDRCKKVALKYDKLTTLRKEQKTLYRTIYSNKWTELLNHVTKSKKDNKYWTYEKCREETLKYKNKKDFREKSISASNVIYKNKWFELFEHMDKLSILKERYIYAFEFKDNHVYVGLTCNINTRYTDHLTQNNSQVYKHIKKTQSEFQFKIITEKPVPMEIAGEIENQILQKYINEGWITLNKAKTGGLGAAKPLWTYEKCKKVALKYDKLITLIKEQSTLYNVMRKNGWLEELTSHIIPYKKAKNHWNNYDNCKLEALKYKTIKELTKNCNGAYKGMVKNGWLEKLTQHFNKRKRKQKPKGYWTYEKCKEAAEQCKRRIDFYINYMGAYQSSLRNKWLDHFYPKIEIM
jgi:predicted GIY-YIG superfamily endonuclease